MERPRVLMALQVTVLLLCKQCMADLADAASVITFIGQLACCTTKTLET